jgi:hypothetical protein
VVGTVGGEGEGDVEVAEALLGTVVRCLYLLERGHEQADEYVAHCLTR